MTVSPFIIGSGRSADALKKSLALLGVQNPHWNIQPVIQIKRDQNLNELSIEAENSLLLIANPPGLHAEAILQGENAGFRNIIVEKPACISLQEVAQLRSVQLPVAVCHIYRQMWGIQTLKQMLNAQELGDLICIEGRYWQSSTALRAITPEGPLKPATWKNDSKLSGPSDAFLDVGVHWVDAVSFLMGEAPQGGKVWLSYANAEAAHRDSHVQLNLEFSAGRRAMGSISKNFHGANNHFEINLIGTQKSATWTFLNPDEIWLGHGTSRTLVTRKDNQLGSKQPPFHGLGWLEGYMEIIRQVILQGEEKPPLSYPTLSEHLNMLQAILSLKNN